MDGNELLPLFSSCTYLSAHCVQSDRRQVTRLNESSSIAPAKMKGISYCSMLSAENNVLLLFSGHAVQCLVVWMLCVGIGFVDADDDWEDFICFGKPTDTLIAHPTDCNLFFVCDGGVGYKNQCPQNAFFNPDTRECDTNYRCGRPSATTWPPHTDSTFYPNVTTPKPARNASTHTMKCPPDDTANVTMFANPSNCSEYYLCYYSKPMRFECPRRYEFSAADKACIPAEQSTCRVCLRRFYSSCAPF